MEKKRSGVLNTDHIFVNMCNNNKIDATSVSNGIDLSLVKKEQIYSYQIENGNDGSALPFSKDQNSMNVNMRENNHEETGKEVMDTNEWTEMTLDNAANIVCVAADKIQYFGKDSNQTSKDLRERESIQDNGDSLYYSGLSSNSDVFSSMNGNYKSDKRKTANEIVTCVKHEVNIGISFYSTSDSQSFYEPRPFDTMISKTKKEQVMSKNVSYRILNEEHIASIRNEMHVNSEVSTEKGGEYLTATTIFKTSDRILNEEHSDSIRNEMQANSEVSIENGGEYLTATSTFKTSSLSVDESKSSTIFSFKHIREDSLKEKAMRLDKPGTQRKEAKMKKKDKGKKRECQICGKVLSGSYCLKNHLETHARDWSFSCRDCGSKFKTLKCLRSHMRIHVQRKIFECALCGEKFKTKNYLVSVHIPKHSENLLNKYKYSCSVCNKKFMSKCGLQIHSKLHIDERIYSCEVCGKTFLSVSGRNLHKNAHTGEDLYACDHCGKSFPRFADLEKHIRIHTGERPFRCDTCDRTYKTYGDLAVHMRKHNPDPRFQCDICGKFCLQSRDLLNHKVIKHGERSTQESVKYSIKLPRECEICGLVCSNSSNYYRHKRRHHSLQIK